MLIRNSLRLAQKLCTYQQQRTAIVVKRFKMPPRLPDNATQEQIDNLVFQDDMQLYRYEIVKETDAVPGEIKVILLKPSEEFGRRGQIRTINAKIARQELLLPGFAVYASPDNLEKYKDIVIAEDDVSYSSSTVNELMSKLSKMVIPLVMNSQNHWKLDVNHIKFALLTEGVSVDEKSIVLPDFPIKGPDPSIMEKEFGVDIMVNDFEKITIRCVLFEQIPESVLQAVPPLGWEKRFYEPLTPDQADMLRMLPRQAISAEDVSTLVDGKKILEEYSQWKSERDKRLFSS